MNKNYFVFIMLFTLASCKSKKGESNLNGIEDQTINKSEIIVESFDAINSSIYFHGGRDVGEKLTLYEDETFFLLHWNTFGSPSHIFGHYTYDEDRIILKDTFGYQYDFALKGMDSTVIDIMIVDTLYLWKLEENKYLSPYPQQPNKSFDYNLFWRDHEEVEMKIDSAPIFQ